MSGTPVEPEDQTGIGADCQELGQGINAGEIQVVPENSPLHSLRHLGQQRCQGRPLTQHPLAKLRYCLNTLGLNCFVDRWAGTSPVTLKTLDRAIDDTDCWKVGVAGGAC